MTAYVHASHAAGRIQVGIHSLQFLATLSLQLAAALASHSPPVPVYRPLLGLSPGPALPPTLWLGNVGVHPRLFDFTHHIAAVVSLVGHHFDWSLWLDHLGTRGIVHRFRYDGEVLGRLRQRLVHRVRVTRVGWLHRDRHHRSGFHIHRVLGLVGQVRPPVLHLRYARIRIVRVHPFFVRPLLAALAIQSLQLSACGVGIPDCWANFRRNSS